MRLLDVDQPKPGESAPGRQLPISAAAGDVRNSWVHFREEGAVLEKKEARLVRASKRAEKPMAKALQDKRIQVAIDSRRRLKILAKMRRKI